MRRRSTHRLALAALPLALALAPTIAEAATHRHALSMFHFNVQYVAGGLVGYPLTTEEFRPEAIEDLIVTQSLAPVLELYAAHPTWGANIEMQGYLLDVLAARHPDTLVLLRDLAMAGQIEVVSFHYSDQLFVAYPAVDWAKSQALTVATFAAHDVPLGTSVFCQEGQSGTAMAEHMAALGYETMVWPKNLWIEQHGPFTAHPLYTFGDVKLIAGAQGASWSQGPDTVETTWTFFDDGELLATGDWNPYFPAEFMIDPAALSAYEASLTALEADGWTISTIADSVAAVQDIVPPMDPPALLDGTWQPGSTRGVAKWLGDRSIWAPNGAPHDRDNHVRTLGYVAHRELVAAETAALVAGIDTRSREQLDSAWRLLAMGQVTDASGINPYRGEVEYGLAHLAEATRIARDVIEDAKATAGLDEPVVIDPEAATMVAGSDDPFPGTNAMPLFDVTVVAEDPLREIEVGWEQLGPGHNRVAIAIGPGGSASLQWPVTVTFPGEMVDALVTTRALDDDAPATFSRADFTFETWQLALPLGLVSLGPSTYLIKDTAHVHLAATIRRDIGDVELRDETLSTSEAATWVFHVFEGSAEEAVALARRINSLRRLVR